MIKRLFCKHNYEFSRNVETYESATPLRPYKKEAVYMCHKCLKTKRVRV